MEAGEQQGITKDTAFFLHNLKSFDKLWKDVRAVTRSKREVDARTEKAPKEIMNLA